MSKDGRTESATPKRREDARKEGQVLKSKEFGNLLVYAAFFIAVMFFQPYAASVLYDVMTTGLNFLQLEADPRNIIENLLLKVAPMIIGLYGMIMLFVTINYVSQVGFLFSTKAITPDPKRMNPSNYFKNIGNIKKSGFEVIKNVLLFVVIMGVIMTVYIGNLNKTQGVLLLSWSDAIILFSSMLKEFAVKLGIIFLLLGIIDYIFQKYEYEQNLKMKKEEVEDEQKDQQGDPKIKNQQKIARDRLLERKVKKEVLDAQLIIVNPTHYSVAIRYKKEKGDSIPRVLLKGVDEMALMIKKIAIDNGIPVIENKYAARKLYKEVEEDEFINEELYEVVGKIIAELIKDGKMKIKK